jgi:hypothetical protein
VTENPPTGGTVEPSWLPMTLPEYVIPAELTKADWQTRVDWLLKDGEGDERNLGVPRYVPRYTTREREILSYLRLSQSGRRDDA